MSSLTQTENLSCIGLSRRKFLGRSVTSLATIAVLASAPIVLTGCPSSTEVAGWLQTAIDDIPTVSTILQSVLAIALDATGQGILDVPAQAILQSVIGTATVALSAAEAAVQAYKANPNASTLADIQAAMIALEPKLTAILNAAHIKDPALVATISGAVNLAISVVASIQLLIPVPNGSAVSAERQKAWASKTPILSKTQIVDQFNALVTTNGYGKHKIHRKFLGL
jgi:hypothetical protein